MLRFNTTTRSRPCLCPLGKIFATVDALVAPGLILSMPFSSRWPLGPWLLTGLVRYFLYARFSPRFSPIKDNRPA